MAEDATRAQATGRERGSRGRGRRLSFRTQSPTPNRVTASGHTGRTQNSRVAWRSKSEGRRARSGTRARTGWRMYIARRMTEVRTASEEEWSGRGMSLKKLTTATRPMRMEAAMQSHDATRRQRPMEACPRVRIVLLSRSVPVVRPEVLRCGDDRVRDVLATARRPVGQRLRGSLPALGAGGGCEASERIAACGTRARIAPAAVGADADPEEGGAEGDVEPPGGDAADPRAAGMPWAVLPHHAQTRSAQVPRPHTGALKEKKGVQEGWIPGRAARTKPSFMDLECGAEKGNRTPRTDIDW